MLYGNTTNNFYIELEEAIQREYHTSEAPNAIFEISDDDVIAFFSSKENKKKSHFVTYANHIRIAVNNGEVKLVKSEFFYDKKDLVNDPYYGKYLKKKTPQLNDPDDNSYAANEYCAEDKNRTVTYDFQDGKVLVKMLIRENANDIFNKSKMRDRCYYLFSVPATHLIYKKIVNELRHLMLDKLVSDAVKRLKEEEYQEKRKRVQQFIIEDFNTNYKNNSEKAS